MKISIVIPSLEGFKPLNDQVVKNFNQTAYKPDDLEILVCEGNQTFAKNVNSGLSKATGEMIVISNNDITLLPGWQDYLHRMYVKCKGIYAFSPDPGCGWLFAFPREVLEAVGSLDERLLNSYEDIDYFIRAALKDYPRYLAPKHYAIHEGGHTVNKIWGTMMEASLNRNMMCQANKEYMQTKWPDIDINAVLHLHWTVHYKEILDEWKKKYGLSKAGN